VIGSFRSRILMLSAALVTLGSLAWAQPAPPAEDLIAGPSGGPWRRLFLDAMVVERSEGLQRTFHAARRHEASPVVVADRPWEQYPSYGGPYLYGTVAWDEGKLRMWYHVHCGGYGNCYAESIDGINWTKPNLGLHSYGETEDTNLFIYLSDDLENPRRASGQCHNPSVIKQTWATDPDKRYALFCYGTDYRHARVAYSPDGLHWTFVLETEDRGLFRSGDVLNFFRDPYRNRFVATWKSGSRRGRAAGVAVSDDGLDWTKPVEGPVFGADDLDPDATQVYGMPVFPYQGMYIGLPWIYNARWTKVGANTDQKMFESEKSSPCTMDVQMAWSWDLINWTRPPVREQFIPRGGEGEFDSGMIYTARAPVQMGDELWFYYGGWVGFHNTTDAHASIGLATLRLDGFCSMSAGADEGWLISRLEQFHVPQVTINAAVRPGGEIVAELLDADEQVIPGFSRDQCVPFTGDAVRHVLTWRTAAIPEAQRGQLRKIRFYIRDADLYSYLPDQTRELETVLWDPAANGWLLPDADGVPGASRFRATGQASGYSIVVGDGIPYADMHAVRDMKTTAAYARDADWSDDSDWAVEAWLRIVDKGDEPDYGLSVWFRPDHGRNAAIYLSDAAVGIQSSATNTDHRVLETVPMDTTDAFHWYRLAHTGGKAGTVTLSVDGAEVVSMPFADLFVRAGAGSNVMFGPNAGHREGRMHVAKFGYSTGSADALLGPVR